MKKIILLIVVLFTAPAMGLVTIDVNDLGDGWVALEYSCTGASAVGFGLDVNVSDGNIVDVNILHVGENDGNGVGFGIFPASFERFIDPNDPNWGNPNYTPVAQAGDPGAAGGMPGPAITIELGALGIAAPNDGRLLELKVDTLPCTICVNNNSSRGGVVLKGGGSGGFTGVCAEIGGGCGTCPMDKSSWNPGVPDGWMGPEDVAFLINIIKAFPGYYCQAGVDAGCDACLDFSSWNPGVPDGWLGPEDVAYEINLIKYTPGYYVQCP